VIALVAPAEKAVRFLTIHLMRLQRVAVGRVADRGLTEARERTHLLATGLAVAVVGAVVLPARRLTQVVTVVIRAAAQEAVPQQAARLTPAQAAMVAMVTFEW